MAYQVTEKSTQHNLSTPHGYNTPHRLPDDARENLSNIYSGMVRDLYPTGRAFYIPEKSIIDALHKGLNVSFIRLIQEAKKTIDKTFPDNINFTEQDATLWEYRLGLFINPDTTLENRRLAIKRKYAYPSNIKARQHPLFIQSQLQLAGFNVWVHENGFEEGGVIVYKTPDQIASASVTSVQHGPPTQHGQGTQHGSLSYDVIANHYEAENYAVGGDTNLWATFFIGGENLGEAAVVPVSRQKEFRELVLKLKPAHTVAFLFVNFL